MYITARQRSGRRATCSSVGERANRSSSLQLNVRRRAASLIASRLRLIPQRQAARHERRGADHRIAPAAWSETLKAR